MTGESSLRLSGDELGLVFRRAAELQDERNRHGQLLPGLDPTQVEEVAREVGLDAEAVRRAVGEFRRGELAPVAVPTSDRVLGLSGVAAVERVASLSPEEAAWALTGWLDRQLFERCRRVGLGGDFLPRRGLVAQARRKVDLRGRYRLEDVARLRVRVAANGSGGSTVRVEAVLDGYRAGLLAGLVAMPTVVGVGVVVVLGGSVGVEALAAVPVVAAVTGAGWLRARTALENRRERVTEELEGALDELC